MFWTVLALALTVVMGGIIAYYGDLIGRKYGKKRLSWFGLRPKYTAILITSIAGALISSLTIGVLFGLVKPVRDVILEGEMAIRDRKNLAAQNGDLNRQKVRTGIELDQKRAELADLISKKSETESKLKQETTQLLAARVQLHEAIGERDSARAMELQSRSRNAALVSKNISLAASNSRLASANSALASKNEGLVSINEALAKQNEKLSADSGKLEKLNSNYTIANEEIARQNENLVRENDQLITKRSQLAQRTKDLSDYNAQLEEKNRDLADANRNLVAKNASLNELFLKIAPGYKSLREAYYASRSKRVVIHKDEDLARQVIPARASPDEVRRLVQDLLHDASAAAITRGASAGDQARAVQVVDHQFVTRGANGDSETLEVTADDKIDAIVRRLSWQTAPSCVVAVAVANSVEQEPAAIDLVPLPNKGIYTRGQEVAVHRVNAGLPVDKLFDDVVGFLRLMGQSALQQGMIPRMDSAGEPQVGSLNAAEIAMLVEQVREYNGMVRIRAIAASNINSADPLALTFKVEP